MCADGDACLKATIMSNQNQKRRIRNRQEKTGQKYTEAARKQKQREAAQVQKPDPFGGLFRRNCDNCGGQVKWTTFFELEKMYPSAVQEYIDSPFYQEGENQDCWVCLECDNFGIMSDPKIGGFDLFASDDEIIDACPQCGKALDWVDPASIAYEHRDEYLKAKNTYGAVAVLNSEAGICSHCGYVEFHAGHGDFI